jgi:hypothetical protein
MKGIFIKITHIPLQGAPYPAKFANGCGIVKEVSIKEIRFLSPKAMKSIQTTEQKFYCWSKAQSTLANLVFFIKGINNSYNHTVRSYVINEKARGSEIKFKLF